MDFNIFNHNGKLQVPKMKNAFRKQSPIDFLSKNRQPNRQPSQFTKFCHQIKKTRKRCLNSAEFDTNEIPINKLPFKKRKTFDANHANDPNDSKQQNDPNHKSNNNNNNNTNNGKLIPQFSYNIKSQISNITNNINPTIQSTVRHVRSTSGSLSKKCKNMIQSFRNKKQRTQSPNEELATRQDKELYFKLIQLVFSHYYPKAMTFEMYKQEYIQSRFHGSKEELHGLYVGVTDLFNIKPLTLFEAMNINTFGNKINVFTITNRRVDYDANRLVHIIILADDINRQQILIEFNSKGIMIKDYKRILWWLNYRKESLIRIFKGRIVINLSTRTINKDTDLLIEVQYPIFCSNNMKEMVGQIENRLKSDLTNMWKYSAF